MKTYICKQPVELSRKDFKRINKLFDVNFNEESPEMEALIDELDARPNTTCYSFWWDFEDNGIIQMDIESDDICYMDNAMLLPEDEEDESFERGFQLEEEMEFVTYDGNRRYICKIQIKEDK